MPIAPAAILEELASAFPARRSDPFAALVNSTMGDEPVWVAEAFADKTDWTKLDPDWLAQVPKGLSSALSFLSNEAVCFYIPAFIAADLEGRLSAADPVFALPHGFAHGVGAARIHPRKPRTWGDHARDRWAALTPPQSRAIVHYLEWKIEQNGPGVDSAAQALADYWYQRAADA